MKTKLSFQAAECTFDDVVFSNRNQAYGAYNLRKTYNKHLLLALLLVSFFFISGFTIPLLYNYLFPPIQIPIEPKVANPTPIPIDEHITIPEIKPPDLNKALAAVLNNNSGQFRPVDTISQTVDQTQFSTANQQTIDTGGIDGPFVLVPQPANNVVPDEETIYSYVEEPATFQGGNSDSFRKWILNNYVYPQAALESRIQGKVTFSFVVDKNGSITDINIARSEHQILSEETIKVISASPKWQPARQNGIYVKQRFYMQIQLVIE